MSDSIDYFAQQAPFGTGEAMDWEELLDWDQWCRDHPVTPEPSGQGASEHSPGIEAPNQTAMGPLVKPTILPDQDEDTSVALQQAHFDFAQPFELDPSFDFEKWCLDQGLQESSFVAAGDAAAQNCDEFAEASGNATASHRIHYEHARPISHFNQCDGTMSVPKGPNGVGMGCRGPRVDIQAPTQILQDAKALDPLTCNQGGCGKSFARKYELRRHIMQCHEASTGHPCTAEGCFKGHSRWRFVRSDKLSSHIRDCHERGEVFSCHACTQPRSFPLEDLALHCGRMHPKDQWSRAIINAASCKRCKCPIWNCRKSITLQDMKLHLESHNVDEIHRFSAHLLALGYRVSYAHRDSDHPKTTVAIQCPVCPRTCDSHEDFKHHLWDAHLFVEVEGGHMHFLAWKATVRAAACSYDRGHVDAAQPWTPLDPTCRPKVREITCDHCAFSTKTNEEWYRNGLCYRTGLSYQHPTFMRPTEQVIKELSPFRMHILRLYPEFESHPIFDDFNTPREDAVAGPSSSQANLSS